MRNLLATTAIALVAMAGTASAQSVLERVLGSIQDVPNVSTVNGTFANIAENIGVLQSATLYVEKTATGDTILNEEQYLATVVAPNTLSVIGTAGQYFNAAGDVISAAEYQQLSVQDAAAYTALTGTQVLSQSGTGELVVRADLAEFNTAVTAANTAIAAFEPVVVNGLGGIANEINGSISNTMEGIAAATASNGSVFAINEVTVDIGDLTTTVLGAVNTGDIALGANMGVSEAVAGASQAIHGTIDQLGGSIDTAALVLNIASNSTSVLGNVNNQFASLNGSIGNIGTTVLGAVNTGTITNGLNASINGTISDLVGASVN